MWIAYALVAASSSQSVEGDFQIADAIVVRWGKMAGAHIDLYRGQNQARHVQGGVAAFAHADKFVLGDAFVHMNIMKIFDETICREE